MTPTSLACIYGSMATVPTTPTTPAHSGVGGILLLLALTLSWRLRRAAAWLSFALLGFGLLLWMLASAFNPDGVGVGIGMLFGGGVLLAVTGVASGLAFLLRIIAEDVVEQFGPYPTEPVEAGGSGWERDDGDDDNDGDEGGHIYYLAPERRRRISHRR